MINVFFKKEKLMNYLFAFLFFCFALGCVWAACQIVLQKTKSDKTWDPEQFMSVQEELRHYVLNVKNYIEEIHDLFKDLKSIKIRIDEVKTIISSQDFSCNTFKADLGQAIDDLKAWNIQVVQGVKGKFEKPRDLKDLEKEFQKMYRAFSTADKKVSGLDFPSSKKLKKALADDINECTSALNRYSAEIIKLERTFKATRAKRYNPEQIVTFLCACAGVAVLAIFLLIAS